MRLQFFSDRMSGTGVWFVFRVHAVTRKASGFLISTRMIRVSTKGHSVAWYRPKTWIPFSIRESRHLKTGKTKTTKLGTFYRGTA